MIETLSWSMLEPYLELGGPWVLAMGGTRQVLIGYDPSSARMYVRLPTPPGTVAPPTKLAEVDVAVRADESGAFLEVSTVSPVFFREFCRFAGLLTEVFEPPERDAIQAFQAAVERWQEFAANRQVLSAEEQLGLLGELLLLGTIIEKEGQDGVTSWTGRDPNLAERHDFRLSAADVEVKSTRGAAREHYIHGLQQLVPVAGRPLYVLSLRFESAGLAPGFSLREIVESIRAVLKQYPAAAMSFGAHLRAAHYRDADSDHYIERLRLADSPRLILVDDNFPRITPSMITSSISPVIAARISNVAYRVNLDGLGVTDASPEYTHALGGLTIG